MPGVNSVLILASIENDNMLTNSNLKPIIILMFCFAAISGLVKAQDSDIKYVTQPGSKLWIDGTSTIDSFTCTTHQVNGYADIENSAGMNGSTLRKDKVEVTVPVFTLDCGKSIMNDDMYNAMEANKYPMITYELIKAHVASKPDTLSGAFLLETTGYLTIAGVRNKVDITIQVRMLSNGRFRLTGKKSLSMQDYGIVPPSHFFGLIRAHDKLVVNFDLIAGREDSLVKFDSKQ